jgi:V8-like Glu-specific endopeptidase
MSLNLFQPRSAVPRSILAASIVLSCWQTLAPQLFAQAEPTILSYSTSRLSPYRYIGRLAFDSGRYSYIGSGTVVTPRGVLTAAHNVYDPYEGYSTYMVFQRGKYNDAILSKSRPSSMYVLSGYVDNSDYYGSDSNAAFSRDLGALRFSSNVAEGYYASYLPDTSYLTGTLEKIAVGYGADYHTGKVPLTVKTTRRCEKIRTGYYDNAGFIVESGMSGGPVFVRLSNGSLQICAVVISGSDFDAGVRAVDSAADTFIRSRL